MKLQKEVCSSFGIGIGKDKPTGLSSLKASILIRFRSQKI